MPLPDLREIIGEDCIRTILVDTSKVNSSEAKDTLASLIAIGEGIARYTSDSKGDSNDPNNSKATQFLILQNYSKSFCKQIESVQGDAEKKYINNKFTELVTRVLDSLKGLVRNFEHFLDGISEGDFASCWPERSEDEIKKFFVLEDEFVKRVMEEIKSIQAQMSKDLASYSYNGRLRDVRELIKSYGNLKWEYSVVHKEIFCGCRVCSQEESFIDQVFNYFYQNMYRLLTMK